MNIKGWRQTTRERLEWAHLLKKVKFSEVRSAKHDDDDYSLILLQLKIINMWLIAPKGAIPVN